MEGREDDAMIDGCKDANDGGKEDATGVDGVQKDDSVVGGKLLAGTEKSTHMGCPEDNSASCGECSIAIRQPYDTTTLNFIACDMDPPEEAFRIRVRCGFKVRHRSELDSGREHTSKEPSFGSVHPNLFVSWIALNKNSAELLSTALSTLSRSSVAAAGTEHK
jgi:hypothetical protein